MKEVKVAIIGLGNRGHNYGGHLNGIENCTVVSICDKYQEKIDKVKGKWNVPDERCFTDEEKFFAQGKIADVMVIATQDKDHYGHAMKALSLGYNLMLEKPVSPSIEECIELEAYARKQNCKILVCHVLRYAHYYRKIKEIIDSGILGKIMLIQHDEDVAFWHYCHSYVRGNWRREEETSPMLLAKCCHDMDLIYWYANSKAKSVSSYGGLRFYKSENKPEGAADNCFDCKYKDTCKFEAELQYIGRKKWYVRTKKQYKWSPYAFCISKDPKVILDKLKNDPKGKLWSRCVFSCDNDVVDCQTVNMEMENGILVQMNVNAFNDYDHRHIEIHGTNGILVADDSGSVLRLKLFGQKEKKIIVNYIPVIRGHFGGDQGLTKATVDLLNDKLDPNGQYTWIEDSIESHRIVTAAEISRHENGRLVMMSEIPDKK